MLWIPGYGCHSELVPIVAEWKKSVKLRYYDVVSYICKYFLTDWKSKDIVLTVDILIQVEAEGLFYENLGQCIKKVNWKISVVFYQNRKERSLHCWTKFRANTYR